MWDLPHCENMYEPEVRDNGFAQRQFNIVGLSGEIAKGCVG